MDEPIKVKHRELGHILILSERECKQLEQDIFGDSRACKPCKQCGKSFVVSPINGSKHEFCSPHCYSKYHYKPKHFDPRPCKECGKIFTPRNDLNIYCSNECWKQVKYKRRRMKKLKAKIVEDVVTEE